MFTAFIISGALALAAGVTGACVKVHNYEEVPVGERDRYGYQKTERQKVRDRGPNKVAYGAAAALAAGSLLFAGFGSFYKQDVGEAKVLRSVSGEVVGESTAPGFHLKAPWVTAISWDVRDNVVEYASDRDTNYVGGSATGPRVVVQDKDGVDAGTDLTVRYSIAADAVEELYARFGTQQNLVTKLIEPSIRSAMREIPAQYGSLELLNKRGDVQTAVRDRLSAEWAEDGIIVEVGDVNIQEIVQPESVKTAFAEAQAARTAVEKEKANLDKARIEAEKNAVATQALTPEILQKAYIDALSKAGAIYVVPQGSDPMIQVPVAPKAGE